MTKATASTATLAGVPSDKPLVTLVMEQDLIDQLDDFWRLKRFKSRASAMRWMVRRVLRENPTVSREEAREADADA